MKKQWRVGMLAAAMTLTALAGCSGGGDSSSTTANSGETKQAATKSGDSGSSQTKDSGSSSGEQITLKYWHYEDPTTIGKLAEAFMDKYPNITVECFQFTDMASDLSTAAAAGELPDVFSGTDSDTALASWYWADITELYNNDPETQEVLPTINEYGLGMFDTDHRFAVPTYYQPSAVFIDRNVIDTLGLTMPRTDWTWDEMIDLIKKATVDKRTELKYFGLGYYNRLDSLYGIAACAKSERAIKGEFGFDGNDFDLSYWAIGEQQFADLILGGYVAPLQDTQAMEDWQGDPSTWCGSTGHVAVFTEGFWTFQNIWNVKDEEGKTYMETHGLDIIPYVTPNVVDEKEHNIIANMYMGGINPTCEHMEEAYELLKWMSFGKDGWNARLDIYEDETITNDSGVALKCSNMPVPLTTDEGVWARYKALFPTDEEHKQYWDDYFASITRPVSYGWYNIAGYWNFCDQYFNKIGIHDIVGEGKGKAADYVEEATRQANYYHAEAMLSYFGPDGDYDVLSQEEIDKYQAVVDDFKG